METYFSENDATLYTISKQKFGSRVTVSQTAIPELKAAYSKIAASLDNYFQPVEFALDKGVFVGTAQSGMYPVKTISEDDDKIKISVFGSEQVFSFPIALEPNVCPVRVPILTAVPMQNQQYTSVFSAACNYLLVGASRVSAWIGNNSEYLSVSGIYSFTVPGKLTCIAPECFESDHMGIRRVWSFSDPKFNSCMAGLPRTVSVFLNEENCICISGLPLAEKRQTLICRTCVALDNSLCLTCATLQNDILFDIRLRFDGNSIIGTIADSYEFSIDDNDGGIYNENK